MSESDSKATKLTAGRLRELFSYDPETGILCRIGHRARRLAKGDRYLRATIDGQQYYVHRLAWLYVHGEWPPGELDHINRVCTDNRAANLRVVTRAQNQANRGMHANNKSGFTGVSRYGGKWRAMIYHNCKKYPLGTFANLGDASAAYQAARARLLGA